MREWPLDSILELTAFNGKRCFDIFSHQHSTLLFNNVTVSLAILGGSFLFLFMHPSNPPAASLKFLKLVTSPH